MNKRFLEYLKIIFNEISQNKPIHSIDAFKFAKNYIYDNPNDNDVLIVKDWIVNEYQKAFLENNFTNALNLPDNLKYLKIQEIYKYLPFIHDKKNFPSYFYSLINSPSEYYGTIANFYKGCFWFFKEQNKCLLTNEQINKINTYLSENKNILNGNLESYDNLDTEILRYKNIFLNIFDKDFYEFKENKEALSLCYNKRYEGNIIIDYKNKKLGNIGEVYVFEKIKNLMNPIFTAKEFGDGFGFDMYFQSYKDNIIYENLIEVKTTSNLNENDYFYLSDNEYNTMINSLNEANVNYLVCRVFADVCNNIFECHLFSFKNNCLIALDCDMQYELVEHSINGYYFKRKEKEKRLV